MTTPTAPRPGRRTHRRAAWLAIRMSRFGPRICRQIDVVGPTGQPRCGTFDHLRWPSHREPDVFVRRARRRTRCAVNTSATRVARSANVPSQWAAQIFIKLTDLHYYCGMTRTVTGSAQAPRGGRLPDFLLVGAPKAGTTALHAALAAAPRAVPQLPQGAEVLPVRRLPAAGVPRARRRAQQPGVDLAAAALPRPVQQGRRGPAGRREHAVLPLPPRRAAPDRRRTSRRPGWSRCCATRSTGRTPTGCTCGRTASSPALTWCGPAPEEARIEDGWAPFWHYRGLGMYGRQLADLFEHFPREQVLVLRYRQLVDEPHRTLNEVCRFLGVSAGRRHLDPCRQLTTVRAPERAHQAAGSSGPGRRCRGAVPAAEPGGLPAGPWSHSCTSVATRRARALSEEQREALRNPSSRTSALLEEVTGLSFADWRRTATATRSTPGRSACRPPEELRHQSPRLVIRSCAPSGRAASK